tara:strand:- start:560 stop:1300 length:741 start_codon:yes stop_codon:yes gene_type:complete
MNMQEYTSKLKDEYKIEVFFDKDLNIKRALSVFNEILLIDGVEEGRFIDKEDASEIFINEFDEDILNIIGSNPLPMGASYGIADDFRTYTAMNKIVDEINSIRNVDEAIFSKGAINKFDKLSRNLLGFSFLLGLFIMFISLFFVSNTIMLVIYSKKDEIKTMNLLGASNMFIKFPYLLEGLILGFIGSVISLIILFWFYKLCIYIIEPHFFITSFNYSSVIVMNLVFGILLGLIGSSRALSSRVIK